MEIRLSARKTELSERERTLVTEKIDRLGKFLPGMDRADVHFSEERNPRIAEKEVCEVTMVGHGHHVRCRANGLDVLSATDAAVDKLENKLHRLKTRLTQYRNHRRQRGGGGGNGGGLVVEAEDTSLADEVPTSAEAVQPSNGSGGPLPGVHIVKVKQFEKLELAPHEAVLRMEMVGHDFYLFTNEETGRPAVVYRREDGDVGLIDQLD